MNISNSYKWKIGFDHSNLPSRVAVYLDCKINLGSTLEWFSPTTVLLYWFTYIDIWRKWYMLSISGSPLQRHAFWNRFSGVCMCVENLYVCWYVRTASVCLFLYKCVQTCVCLCECQLSSPTLTLPFCVLFSALVITQQALQQQAINQRLVLINREEEEGNKRGWALSFTSFSSFPSVLLLIVWIYGLLIINKCCYSLCWVLVKLTESDIKTSKLAQPILVSSFLITINSAGESAALRRLTRANRRMF